MSKHCLVAADETVKCHCGCHDGSQPTTLCEPCNGTGRIDSQVERVISIWGAGTRWHAEQIASLNGKWFDDTCIGHGGTPELALATARKALSQ